MFMFETCGDPASYRNVTGTGRTQMVRFEDLSANSYVNDLRDFVKEHKLPVDKACLSADARMKGAKAALYEAIAEAWRASRQPSASAAASTPTTGTASRTQPQGCPIPIPMAPLSPGVRQRQVLDLGSLSASSPLLVMKAFIDEHNLDVAKNVGGHASRTKADIFEDIKQAARRVSMFDADEDCAVVPPSNPGEMTLLLLNKRTPISLKHHIEFCIKKLGESQDPARAMACLLDRGFKDGRLNAKANGFIIDHPSAKGLAHSLGLTTRELCQRMAAKYAIEREIEAHGTDEDKECLNYVLLGRAGESDLRFPNGVRDQNRHQETFEDFCGMEEAQKAGLDSEEVLALRLYTTAVHKSLNEPLRAGQKPHPMPATVGYLHSGIKKLRENGKQTSGKRDFFRGMRDMQIDFNSKFMQLADKEDPESYIGGVEKSTMSCSSELKVALQYGASKSCLIFKIATDGFRQRGADLAFLSAFPEEAEYVYPPGTFLKPTGKQERIEFHGAAITVIEVFPDID